MVALEQWMYFTLIRSKAAAASMQTNLSLLEALVLTARSRFTSLLARLSELHNQSLAVTLSESVGHSRKSQGDVYSLVGATRDMIAIIKAMDRMADELLLESRQSWGAVGDISSNVHEIAFGRWRLLGGRKLNDLRAVAVEEKLRRTPRLVISLLEVATILEESVADLAPMEGPQRTKQQDCV
ncbi:hypothetical protein XI05_00305 [Bradyrhizobium sp. CCBAU 11357]|nr:hypothetical protein [Bradyrhizobium sp. CCBAU 11357]